MSVAAATASAPAADVEVLRDLYGRCKALTLSIGAGLLLGSVPPGVGEEVDELRVACEAAEARLSPTLGAHLAACREATAELAALLEPDAGGGSPGPSSQSLSAARAGHRRFRKLYWELDGCEYTPCAVPAGGAGPASGKACDG